MARVFLSYASDDLNAAKQLADGIALAGHDVWWDRHLHGGSRFSTEIDRALKDAEAVVVLWSPASVESVWVQDEAAEGRDAGRLVPLAMGSVKPPLGFRQFHTINLAPWNGNGPLDALQDVLGAIGCICGSDADAHKTSLPHPSQIKTSICVLPFSNMSGEPEQEYFSDGISEDIITDLSNISALSVIARNTAFTFKGQSLDVKLVAQKLGVTHVLEGSVRKAGNRVRITAQLIDGAKGDHVWASRYDRDLTDIFEIQDEISKAIVDSLQLKLLPNEKSAIENRGTGNIDAYNLYLLARQQWISGTNGDPGRDDNIVRFCYQATLLDPSYAEAWALMALAQAELRFWHAREDQNALPAAQRALEINPEMPEALCIKARYLEEEGRRDEALELVRNALKLGPDSWEVNREVGRMFFRFGQIREAIPLLEKATSMMDSDFANPGMLISCYNAVHDRDGVLRAAKIGLQRTEKAIVKEPANVNALAIGAIALSLLGEKARAREWISRALLLDPDNLSMRYNLACSIALELDDPEGALNALEPYFEKVQSRVYIRHLEADPDFNPIRDHPRFKKMLTAAKERLGMPITSQ